MRMAAPDTTAPVLSRTTPLTRGPLGDGRDGDGETDRTASSYA